jgi:hypothetical protein
MTENQAPAERMATTTLDLNAIARLAFLLGVASLPVILDSGAIAQAASLYYLAESAHPYWVPSHGVLLYVRAPAVAISACALLLTPGLFLALAVGMTRTIGVWVLAGFMLSMVAVSVAAAVVQLAIGVPLVDDPFVATVLGLSAACVSLLWFRVIHGHSVARPWAHIHSWTTIAVIVGWSVPLLISLAPKFYWDSFNGDGAHTFEAARLLLHQPVPFFGASAGNVSSFPGMTAVLYLYPASWFIRLFGDIEAAVRIPFILELTALYCAIAAVAEQGSVALSRVARWLIALSLTVYAVTMAFSATYSPYSADIALPATQDTLLVAMFLAYVLFFLDGRRGWMALAIVLTYLTLPSGLMLILLWLAAVMFWRPRPWPLVIRSFAVILICVVAGALVTRLLPVLGVPGPGGEYRAAGLLKYFAFVQFTDWHRILYVLIPAGLIPVLVAFAWKRHDHAGRTLALVAFGYFCLFFIQAHIALHHFVPAMILPLVVFWRYFARVNEGRRQVLLSASAAASLGALVISLPQNAGPETISRRVGFSIEDRTQGYVRSDPLSFRRAELFAKLFPIGWEAVVPERSFGGSPLVWLYYAHHAPRDERAPNYVLQTLGTPAPAGMRLIAGDRRAALYVRSDSVWRQHLALRPPTPAGSAIYVVPRGTLFRSESAGDGQRTYSMMRVLRSIGLDTAFISNRFGAKR